MGLGREEEVETSRPPRFMLGTKVVSTKYVKNDGTFVGKDIGEVLVRKGDVGDDEERAAETRVQKFTDEHTARIDDLLKRKEGEITEV